MTQLDAAKEAEIMEAWGEWFESITDLPPELSLEMGGEILRMNVAVMALMIGSASEDAIFADGLESGVASAWSALVP